MPDSATNSKSRFSVAAKIARRLGMDRAVTFAVLARSWQLLTGPITQLMIVFLFSEVEQGFYYAFLNLLALQIFVELGLHVVLIHVASHEWGGMTYEGNAIQGNIDQRDRLASLSTASNRWYSIAAIFFFVIVSALGTIFFQSLQTESSETLPTLQWIAPWITLVLLTAFQLALLPRSAILEGCGRLPVMNRIRFWTGIAGSLTVWLLISSGVGLWALCGSAAVRCLGEYYCTCIRYQPFFQSLQQSKRSCTFNWKTEILPLQWRIAVQGTMLWLANHLAGLVLLKSHGLGVSGRFGMMWTVLSAMQAAALAWVDTRRPHFGVLIASGERNELDDLYQRVTRVSITVLSITVAAFTAGIWIANQFSHWFFEKLSERLPEPIDVGIFALAMAIFQLAQCANIYVRSHKEDPFLIPAIVSSATTACLMVCLGHYYGIKGTGIGYFLGAAVIQTPWWLIICRRISRQYRSIGQKNER